MVMLAGQGVQLTLCNCQWCGKPLPKGRADMKCHKDCRNKLYRWKKKQEKQLREVVIGIEKLAVNGKLDFYRELTIEQLKVISEALSQAYSYNNIRRVS